MRKAARIRRIQTQNRVRHLGFLAKLLIFPIVLVAIFLFLKLSTKYWNGKDKLVFAYRLTGGDVAVTVDDPKGSEAVTFIIPGETEVDVSGNYGTLRLKNVWQLGINEKLGGSLLPATISKNFLFPVFLWSDSDIQNLDKGNIPGILKFVVVPKNTNIPFGDRLNLGLFALQVKSIDKTEINLRTGKFLQKAVLTDGAVGYNISSNLLQRLTPYFVDDYFSSSNLRVEIVDETGTTGVSDTIGEIIQVLGGKIVSIDKKGPPDTKLDCQVGGESKNGRKKVAELFNCKIREGKSNFDVEIELGEIFARRF